MKELVLTLAPESAEEIEAKGKLSAENPIIGLAIVEIIFSDRTGLFGDLKDHLKDPVRRWAYAWLLEYLNDNYPEDRLILSLSSFWEVPQRERADFRRRLERSGR